MPTGGGGDKVKKILSRNNELKAQKNTWLDQWQLIGEYIHTRRMDFTSVRQPGEFLTREVFDSVGPKSAKTAASSLLSMLWPQSTRRFRLRPPKGLQETHEIKTYYEAVTARVIDVMDDPRAGLPMALDEYMLEQVTFGTAGIDVLPDPKTKVSYKAWGVKHISISEDRYGFVDTIYIEVEKTVEVVVKEYGIDKVSERVRKLFNEDKHDENVRILIAIEPRLVRDSKKTGNRDMPFQSVHIEIEKKHILRESGFSEVPIKVVRFWKLLGEKYGRSPGMDALSDILEANAIWEAVTIGIEKNLDPPLGVLDDGKLGGGDIDTSAGAITVFNITGRAGEKNPIFPLFTVGEIKQALQLLESLSQSIADHFFIDRLLDFNNETRMTLGEAQLRNRLRNSSLGGIFTRQIAEGFSPIVERTFNVLFSQGEMGVVRGSVDEIIQRDIEGQEPLIIPEAVAKLIQRGKDVYNIEYFTPAMRIMQAEESEGMMRTWEFAGVIAQGVPQVLDNLDEDVSLRRFGFLQGAPSEMMRAISDVDTIREEREAAAQEAAQAEQMRQGAEAIRNLGQSGMVPTLPAAQNGKKK